MKKTIRCRDIGYDCDCIIQANGEEEAMFKAAAHARKFHNLQWLTMDVAERLRRVLFTEWEAA
ncbi:MAG: DUF1059 domain-containing protein [Eudoraea sp.]|nr:DUF1059 domain-containing protein [Eudoraea sp.]